MTTLGGCIPAWTYGPPVGGIDGLETISILSSNPGMSLVSLVIMAAWLVICAAWAMWPSIFAPVLGGGVPKSRSPVRYAVALDAAFTSIFVLAVTTQLNKGLLVLAAIHNWTEWVMLGNVYLGFLGAFTEFGQGLGGLTLWNRSLFAGILLQILGIMLIDKAGPSFIFEEVFGLWTDLQLVFISAYCWFATRKDPDVRAVMSKFAIASFFHMVLILTLQLEFNLVVGVWPLGQACAMIFSILNFSYFTMFALSLDSWLCEQEISAPESAWTALSDRDPEKASQAQSPAGVTLLGRTSGVPALEGDSIRIPKRLPGIEAWSSCKAVAFIVGALIVAASITLVPITLGVFCK